MESKIVKFGSEIYQKTKSKSRNTKTKMALVAPNEKTFWGLLTAGRVPGGGQTILSDRRADGQTDGRTNGRTDGRTGSQKKKVEPSCFTLLCRKSCRNSCRNSAAQWTLAKKKEVPCPAVPAPKGTVAVPGRRPYIYIYIYYVYNCV